MDLTNQVILIASFLVLISVLASLLSARIGVPVLLVFLVLGMLMGEDGPGGIQFDDVQFAHLVGTLALAIILLDGGMRTSAASFRIGLAPALSLATVGVVITSLVTGLATSWLLGIHWLQGLLLGAIVGSTDAAAVFSLLHSQGLELKQRVAATLEIESGSNDPMAIFMTITIVELALAGQTGFDASIIADFAQQMGVGAALGVAGGFGLVGVANRLKLAAGLYPLLVLSGGLALFGATSVAKGSGFLAVYIAGIILGNRPMQAAYNVRRFHDGIAWLSQIAMFLMLGLLVTPTELIPMAPQALTIAFVLILVARPAAVLAALAPFRFTWRERIYISWVGLRGAVPIILALFPLLAGLRHAEIFFNITFFVVLVSLILQGWSVAPAARWLGVEVPPRGAVRQRLEVDIPGAPGFELVGYHLSADSPAVGRSLDRLPLPPSAQPAAVIRGRRVIGGRELDGALAVDDDVYFFTTPEDLEVLDRMLVAVHAPQHLEEHRFFGEFVLRGDVRMGDLADVYGLRIPAELADRTIEEHFKRTFSRPVVADRVIVDQVHLVVREVADDRVTAVGLKLGARRHEGWGPRKGVADK